MVMNIASRLSVSLEYLRPLGTLRRPLAGLEMHKDRSDS